jgi:hypothetical protein
MSHNFSLRALYTFYIPKLENTKAGPKLENTKAGNQQ